MGNSKGANLRQGVLRGPGRSASCHVQPSREGRQEGKPSRLPVRVYPCDVCDGWHLTAKPVEGRTPPGTMTLTGFALPAPRIFSSGPPKSSQGHADDGSEPGGGFLGPAPNSGRWTTADRAPAFQARRAWGAHNGVGATEGDRRGIAGCAASARSGVARNPPGVSLSCSRQPARCYPHRTVWPRLLRHHSSSAPLEQLADGVSGAPGVCDLSRRNSNHHRRSGAVVCLTLRWCCQSRREPARLVDQEVGRHGAVVDHVGHLTVSRALSEVLP